MKCFLLILTFSLSYFSIAQSKKYSPEKSLLGDEIIAFNQKLLIADILTNKPQIVFENLGSLSNKEFVSQKVTKLFDEKGNFTEHQLSSFNFGFV